MGEATMKRRRAPLDAMLDRLGGAAAHVEPVGFRALVNLRGRPDDKAFRDAAAKASGVDLPLEPNSWRGSIDKAALWLGPDEWLLLAPDGEAHAIEAALRTALADDPWLSVVDVSNNYVGIAVSGAAARDVLAKGCPLDLHPRAFAPGACAQTILAKSRALLRLVDDRPYFEIWVRNSFARYLAEWLLDAAREYESG